MFFKQRLAIVLALLAVLLLGRALPVNAQDDDYTRIYKLARELHTQNLKVRNYTSWVNGNIGIDVGAAPTRLRVGQVMPRFRFNKPGNVGTLTNTDLKAPYMINMWASWCPPCRDEFPMLADGIDSGNVNIPVLFVDMSDKRPDASIFLLSISSDVNVAYDDRTPLFATRAGIESIPQTILVGTGDRIQAIHSGAMSELSLRFFMEIAAHPGVGAFDSDRPDRMPPKPAQQATQAPTRAATRTPTQAPTQAPTQEADQAIFKPKY